VGENRDNLGEDLPLKIAGRRVHMTVELKRPMKKLGVRKEKLVP